MRSTLLKKYSKKRTRANFKLRINRKDHREKSVSSLFQKRIHIEVVKMRDTKMIKRMKNMTNNTERATSLDREKIVGQVV